jgi:hypothetical protein
VIALLVALAAANHAIAQSPNHNVSVDLRVTRTVAGARLRVSVNDANSQAAVRRFALVDGKPMHLFVVGGAGLRVFRHEQPEPQPDGSFVADFALPEPGLYMAFADFHPEKGLPQLYQKAFTTSSLMAGRVSEPADEPHASNGIRADVDASKVKSGVESTLTFDLADEISGAPTTDLERLLGSSAQLFIVSTDLTEGRHLHSQDADRGPRIVFAPVFPHPGRYKIWLEVLRAGRLTTIPFLLDVP